MVQVVDKLLKACCSDGLPFMPGQDDSKDEVEKPQKTQNGPVTNNKIKFGNKKARGAVDAEERQEPAPTGKSKFSGKLTKYEDLEWDEMPKSAQDAAGKLGYDKEKWDNDGWPECEDKWWEDLTAEEREGATELGWDITSWDTKYEDKDFDDLDDGVKEAAVAMGFTKEMWDGNEWPTLGAWEDMSPEQQACANVLGYTKLKWD